LPLHELPPRLGRAVRRLGDLSAQRVPPDAGNALRRALLDARPWEIDVALATLDKAGEVTPEYHIWMADALPWDRPGDGLPQYRGWKKDG
jgi:hypothetical protein